MEVAVGDVIFHKGIIKVMFSGDNFNCPHSARSDLIIAKQEHNFDLKEIIAKIREYSAESHTIIFSGGEPLLQRQASRFWNVGTLW